MNIADIKDRIRGGEFLYVSIPTHGGACCRYSLRDGSEVSPEQFQKLRDDLVEMDPPLLPGCHPLSYKWRADQ